MMPTITKQYARLLADAFNMTTAQYLQLFDHQQGRCFICRKDITEKRHLDHDHKTGLVRGLLCSQCNRALGKAEDPRWQWGHKELFHASLYIENPPTQDFFGTAAPVGFPGKIGTFRYRTWLAAKKGKPKPKRKVKKQRTYSRL